MIIVDLSKKGFPQQMARLRKTGIRSNPFTSRKDMRQALEKYLGTQTKGLTGGNKKTSGSSTHVTGDNLKLSKSARSHSVAYITKGLAITSANYLARFVRDPDEQAKLGLTPADLGLSAADVETLKRDKGVCPGATAGCMAVCLVDAGQQGTPTSKIAQIRKHLAFKFSRDALMASIAIECVNLIQSVQEVRKNKGRIWHKAKKARTDAKGVHHPAVAAHWEHVGQAFPAMRLNINSDIDWENAAFEVDPWLADIVSTVSSGRAPTGEMSIMDLFARTEMIFYDYTKRVDRFMKYATAPVWPSNYFLTFSLSESPLHRRAAMEYIAMVQDGKAVRPAQIAVPFVYYQNGERLVRLPGKRGVMWPFPKSLTIFDEQGRSVTAPVLDADASDARFDDAQYAPGSIAGLRFKEVLAKSKSGTMATYAEKHVDPSIKKGFLLPHVAGASEVVIGVSSGGRVWTSLEAALHGAPPSVTIKASA